MTMIVVVSIVVGITALIVGYFWGKNISRQYEKKLQEQLKYYHDEANKWYKRFQKAGTKG